MTTLTPPTIVLRHESGARDMSEQETLANGWWSHYCEMDEDEMLVRVGHPCPAGCGETAVPADGAGGEQS